MAKNTFQWVAVKKAVFPNFALPQTTLEQVARITEQSIIDNILQQKQATGAPLKKNAPGTIRRKMAEGKAPRSLVDQYNRFIQMMRKSWVWTITGAGTTKQQISIKPNSQITAGGISLRVLNESVQKKGYVGWFAANKAAIAAIKTVMGNYIKTAAKALGRRR